MSKTCNKCGSPISFIQAKNGKWWPVEPGKPALARIAGGPLLIDGELISAPAINEEGYIPHWRNCIMAETRPSTANEDFE